MRRLAITFFYTGLSPIAPGTVGSIAASAVLFGYLQIFHSCWDSFLLAGLALACILSVIFGKWAVRHYHRKDPQMFVLDEVAGIFLANLFLPAGPNWKTILLALVMFRIFDVTKPPPARQLEKLPAGWGILLDDLAAATFANMLCRVVMLWWKVF